MRARSPAPAGSGPRGPAGRFRSRRRRGRSARARLGSGKERTPRVRMVLECVARIVKVQLPAYLKRLPIPESITGFARLTGNASLQPVPILASFQGGGWGRESKNLRAEGRGGAWRRARDPVIPRSEGGGRAQTQLPGILCEATSRYLATSGANPGGSLLCPSVVRAGYLQRRC